LVRSLKTNAPPRNRDEEQRKARERRLHAMNAPRSS
jgi:hypothetical protein